MIIKATGFFILPILLCLSNPAQAARQATQHLFTSCVFELTDLDEALWRARSQVHESEYTGLPTRHNHAKRISTTDTRAVKDLFLSFGWSTHKITGALPTENIIMLSDFGPSLWEPSELSDWMKLDEALVFEDETAAELELKRIVENKGYCPPGILPFLCDEIRKSRTNHDTFFLLSAIEAKHNATRVFILLGRETLLRHTLIMTSDNKVQKLNALLGAYGRLAIASLPGLLPMAPYLAHRVFDLEPLSGDDVIPIFDRTIKYSEYDLSLMAFAESSREREMDVVGDLVDPSGETDKLTPHARNVMTTNLKNWFRLRFQDFNLRAHAGNAKIDFVETGHGGLFDIKITGLNPAQKLLFYHYVGLQDPPGP